MTTQDNRRLARCVRRLEELHTWRNAQDYPIPRARGSADMFAYMKWASEWRLFASPRGFGEPSKNARRCLEVGA